jgi:hypothetical protein
MNTEIEIYHASAKPSGYGHIEIKVELFLNGKFKEFSAITDNMPDYDAASELEGNEKCNALYKLIEHKISNSVDEWIEELN